MGRNQFFNVAILIVFISICNRLIGQFVIDNRKDDFNQIKRVYSKSYNQSLKGNCIYPTTLEIKVNHALSIYTGCNARGITYWYITLTIEGKEKKYSFSGGSSDYLIDTPPTSSYKASTEIYCDNALRDQTFLLDFARATKIAIQINNFPYETNYFSMNLESKNTIKALDFIFNGEYSRVVDQQKEIETEKKEKAAQEKAIKATVETLIGKKNVIQAQIEFNKLDKNSLWDLEKNSLESRIQALKKKNLQEISQLLQSKKIDEAIDLYNMTGNDETIFNQIKSALSEKYPETKTPLENSKIVSFLSSNAISELKNVAFDSKRQLFLEIQKNGQAMLKNSSTILKQFKAEDRFISTNSYKDISFPVDANYSLSLEVDSIKSSIFGLEFSKDFIQFKSDIDAKKLAYYSAKNGLEQIILTKVADGNDSSKKYSDVKRINNFEFSNDYSGKKARIIYTCPLLVNGQSFSNINYKDKNYITTFKKFK